MVALNCWDAPGTRVGFAGEILITAPGGGLMIIWAEPALVGSACKTAATVTVRMLETFVGAV